jgi:phosphoglycolate phosphatase
VVVPRGKQTFDSSFMGDHITRFSEVRALIFDLDGTLIDSKLDLALAVNATLAELGRNPLPHEQIFSYVGQGAPALIARALGSDASEEDCMLGLEFFIKYYSAHKLDNTALYPGVRETLDALKGMPMAVYTNKPVRVSRSIIKELGVSGHFRFVYGGNSFERKKPDPMGVESILREFGAAPAQVMIVGDSEVDVQTARNSGTWVCGVTYGFGSHRLTEYPPDLLVDNLTELLPHLSGPPVRQPR